MNKLFELMKLQGIIRLSFVKQGVSQEKALELAGEALHIFLTSNMAKDEYRTEYEKGLDK